MHRTAVINVVGLTPKLLGPAMPRLSEWASRGRTVQVKPAFPAVTCTAQSDYLTGQYPDQHGIVGNGWYARDDAEVKFWKQSNRLVQARKIWDEAKTVESSFTCANLFWWFNMYSTVEYSVTPRPIYRADGGKLPDVYTTPASLRSELQRDLGTFPLFDFWGPRASIKSTKWIADAARRVEERFSPTLSLVYLPHLDYNLQRVGPGDPATAGDLRDVDGVAGDLIQFYEQRGTRVIVLSEYGLKDVSRPVHLNRALREHGLIAVREELGGELLDPGASAAFAVADHQVAHVYLNDSTRASAVRNLLEKVSGVEIVLDRTQQAELRIGHERAGDFVAVSAPDAWFTYYYWQDDARAPDYARTVDIHRKPGYDPAELLLDPTIRVPALKIGWTLAKKKAGFRTVMDVIPLDASLVKGSHGRPADWSDDGPLVVTQQTGLVDAGKIRSVDVYRTIWRHLTE